MNRNFWNGFLNDNLTRCFVSVWNLISLAEESTYIVLERVCSQTQLCQLRCLMTVLDNYMFRPLLAVFRLSLRELKVLLPKYLYRVKKGLPRRILGPRREKVTGGWWRFRIGEFRNLYSLPNIGTCSYMLTLAGHFPSTRWSYKQSTWNETPQVPFSHDAQLHPRRLKASESKTFVTCDACRRAEWKSFQHRL